MLSNDDGSETSADQWMPVSPAIDSNTFDSSVGRNGIIVVHFWAIWDRYDRTMDAMIQELRPIYDGRIKFFSFNVDPQMNWNITVKYLIKSVPALGVFIDGAWLETMIGL